MITREQIEAVAREEVGRAIEEVGIGYLGEESRSIAVRTATRCVKIAVAALEAENARLRELLRTCREYADHDQTCADWMTYTGEKCPCKCGWDEERTDIDAALAAWKEEK